MQKKGSERYCVRVTQSVIADFKMEKKSQEPRNDLRPLEARGTRAIKSPLRRRHLRVPWTARRSKQSILKEISPEYSLEELTLKLKL